jgi:hypothetical protein
MKVAFYMTTVLEHGGGMENFLITTAKNLSQNKDTIVDIITMDDSTTQQISNLLRFYNFKRNKTKLLKGD